MDKKELLKVVGSILWWAEGSKSRHDKRWKKAVSYPIEITNTDPAIIKLFLSYITEIVCIPEDKIRVQVQVHANDDVQQLEKFWSHTTGIPISRFNKTIIRPVGNKPNKSKGTCKIRCYDKGYYGKIAFDLQEVLSRLS
jgi:hypothetical protein